MTVAESPLASLMPAGAGIVPGEAAMAGGASSEYPKPRNEAEAARQFEALLIGQMLRTAHETDSGLGSGEDSTGDTMWDVSAQQFAQVLANNGGLGLARLITQGLHDREAAANPPADGASKDTASK